MFVKCAVQLNSQLLQYPWKKKVSILGCWLENISGSRQQRSLLTGWWCTGMFNSISDHAKVTTGWPQNMQSAINADNNWKYLVRFLSRMLTQTSEVLSAVYCISLCISHHLTVTLLVRLMWSRLYYVIYLFRPDVSVYVMNIWWLF